MGILSKIKSVVMASTATKFVTTTVVVAALVGGIVGITYPAAFSSAESIVVRAAMATFTGQTSASEETFGWKALTAAFKEKGVEISAKTTVKEFPLRNLGLGEMTLPNVGLQIVAGITPQKEISAVADAKVANMTLLSGNAYLNQDQLQFNVPKLFQSVLTLNYNDADVEQKIKNSYAAEYFGLTETQIETFVDYLPKQTKVPTKEEFLKKLIEILVAAYREELEGTELKKAGTEELHGKDTVKNCKVYAAEMNARQVGMFLDAALTQLREYAKEISAGYNMTEQQMEEAFGDAFAWVDKIRANLRADVVVKFYVWEERIVKITVEWTMAVVKDGSWTTEPGSLGIDFAPEGNPTENMYLSVHTPIHQDTVTKNVPQRVDLIYQVKTENIENNYSVNYQAKYNSMPMTVAFNYDKLNGGFVVKAANQERSLTLTGTITELTRGKKIGLDLETYCHVKGNAIEEKQLDVTVVLRPLTNKVTSLTGNQQDILAMTKSNFNSLEKEISRNITKLLFSMLGLFQ